MEYPEYYKILELPTDAELAEIKKQYRKLAKKYHPDMNPDDKTAEDKFKKLKEAYEVLIDENRRAAYDLEWKKQRDIEREARKKENLKAKEKPKNARAKSESSPAKAPTIRKNKKSSDVGKRVFRKIFRFVFIQIPVLVFCISICFYGIKNKDTIFDLGQKTLNGLSELGEFVADNQKYLLKREVATNDMQKVRSIIEEKQEQSPENSDIINIKNSDGYSLLMLAQTAEMSQMLIDNGAEVNYQAPDGTTALLSAVRNNNAKQVEILLRSGANPEIKDEKSGYNALMIAQSDEIAYLLLKYGANPNFIAADGTTALSKATAEHNRNRLNLLQQFGAQINWSDVLAK